MQMSGRTKLIQALALLVIGMAMLLEPQDASAGGDECSPTCGWEECVDEDFCEDQSACANLSEECLDCDFTLTCGDACDDGKVDMQCWVVPPDGGGGGAN